jgi:histidine triad (HIT) family protein
VIYQSEAVLAFLDIGPLAEGHVLVVPKDHYRLLVDMPSKVCAAIAAILPGLSRALLEVTEAEGFNLLQNNGAVAGQVVEHVHFHLIPRRSDDGLGYRWAAGSYPRGRAAEIAQAYQNALAKVKCPGGSGP